MEKGFTLIEMLIVFVIIGIISTVLFLGTSSAEEKLALSRSAYQLMQDLRNVQEMAMGAGETVCDPDSTSLHSFGVYFHENQYPNSYLIFADCNGNKAKDSPTENIREVQLEEGVIIQNISPNLSTEVVFLPPNPKVYINKKEWTGDVCEVTLALESDPSDPDKQKIVSINSAGMIEIE